jgi:hypothetical protein
MPKTRLTEEVKRVLGTFLPFFDLIFKTKNAMSAYLLA